MTDFMRERRDFLTTVVMATGGLTLGGPIAETSAAVAEDKFLSSAKLGNFDFYYEVHGEGPAVVFAHGGGGNHLSWWQQVPVFSQHYKCITFDHRSFGLSRDVAGGPGRGAYVQDLKALLDKLGVQKVSLVGQSMGGLTVLGFASKYPERVNALVMCDTTGGYSDPEIARMQKQHQEERARAGNTGLLDAVSEGFRKRDPVHAFLYREITSLTIGLGAPPAPGAAPAAAPAPIKTDIGPILAKKVPTLFIVGAVDALVPPPIIEAMHKKMPGSKLVKIPDAGHSVYFEKPTEFNQAVLQFLQEHTRSTTG